jgi:DNA-directed RNA polymerase subunit RPC12/RpoP
MKKKLIHVSQDVALKCDNKHCDFVVKELRPKLSMKDYIGYKCPQCNYDMLTKADHKRYEKVMQVVNFINKWFGWMGSKADDEELIVVKVDTHKEIKITKN